MVSRGKTALNQPIAAIAAAKVTVWKNPRFLFARFIDTAGKN